MTDSILNSIKKLLGILPEDESFDSDIVIHINSVFMILNQLGIGPSEGFQIEDNTAEWSSYVPDEKSLAVLKSYIYIKVRLLFDPPQTSMLVNSMERMVGELEYRLFVRAEELTV